MRPILVLIPLAALNAQVHTPDFNSNAAAAYESLLRLRTTATVLHITAHPDDEDGSLLTWLARAQGVRTGLLTLTRGEGGANLIGPELFDALGLLRTEELLAADGYYGVDQFFTRAADFGFSKRVDETFDHWDKEIVLRDCVRVVRLYRPDVIISRFAGDPRDGHGNHQAAGVLSAEVFQAAADPNLFPEQFREGLRPWAVKKLYRSTRPADAGALRVDTGVYDPQIGMSYAQIAAAGLRLQRSQGAGRRVLPGPAISALALIATAAGGKPAQESTIFDGLDTTLRGLAELAPALHLDPALAEIEKDVTRAIEEFDARDPSRVLEPHIVPALRNLRAVIRNVSDSQVDPDLKYDLLFRLRNKEDEFMRAGNLLAAISLEVAAATTGQVIPGEKFAITSTITNRSLTRIENVELGLSVRGGIEFSSKPGQCDVLGDNQRCAQQFEVAIRDDATYTRPYFSRKDPYRDDVYQIDAPQYANLPFAPSEITGTATYSVAGVRFNITRPARNADLRPVSIAPAVSVALAPRASIMPVSRRPVSTEAQAEIFSNVEGPADVKVRLELPQGWTSNPAEAQIHFTHAGEVQDAGFRVTAPQIAARRYELKAVAEYAGREYREGYETIAHPDLEPRELYRAAQSARTGVDVRVAPNLKIGYIMGTGDQVPAALDALGIKTQLLSPEDLARENLAPFDAIVVGIRASAVRPDYAEHNVRLLEYVKNGGNLIVEYQTPEFDAFPYGPYPFKMGARAEEVSEEDAKVTILDPLNPVFNSPNKITAADFEGWVEERGSKFMTEWDARYKPLAESHDRDQAPQRGGFLEAHYGKGTFTYVAYALYRQLPAGVPGAYRLLANLVSRGKK
ncbi:MAG TPA: PIG-L family deacetylase [Bryobacteraceae bacterium]|nr:PIG-L family deacetylase [Bryobacteraceae bacterium]